MKAKNLKDPVGKKGETLREEDGETAKRREVKTGKNLWWLPKQKSDLLILFLKYAPIYTYCLHLLSYSLYFNYYLNYVCTEDNEKK